MDKVAFTGSTEVGRLIVQAAAGNLKKVTLELGGKSPNIVFDDADTGAVEGAANAIFFNHGQCCVAGSRLFVQEDRFDEVVSGVAEIAKGIKLGPGMESSTQMGPLVSEEQLRRVTGFLQFGVTEGATPTVTGGGRFGDQGYFVEPTVITNTRPDMKIVREEIFGPVVVAEPFRSLDEIAAEANNTSYGLGAGIWTRDISKAHALAKKLRAVWINCYNVFDASLPFGGYKQSGRARDGPRGPRGLHRSQGGDGATVSTPSGGRAQSGPPLRVEHAPPVDRLTRPARGPRRTLTSRHSLQGFPAPTLSGQLAQFSSYKPDDPTSWGGIGAIEQLATDRPQTALVATSTQHP